MKAVRFHEHGGPEVLTFEDVPDPRPAAGEAVVRVRACALNRLDIWKRQGMPHVTVPMPHISGSDVAGEVASRRPLILPTASACARVRRGEDVLVLAAGSGVGQAAIQVARLHGARVFATAGSDAKLERARALGASAAIHHHREDVAEEVKRLTNRRGVDVVIEHVGKRRGRKTYDRWRAADAWSRAARRPARMAPSTCARCSRSS